MSTPYQLKCRWSWKRKQIEVFIDTCEGVVPPLTVKKSSNSNGSNEYPTPKELLGIAIQYAVYAEAKHPALSQKVFYKEGPFKMQYYQARNAAEAAARPPKPYVSPFNEPKVHVCELKGGTEYCGDLKLEGIPDVIGDFSAWKTWTWSESEGKLKSPSYNFIWEPLQIVEAKCHQCEKPPCTRCSCGIYAGTEAQATSYGQILGLLKQWGRFVEGSSGVKSQFAYPQEFHLKPGQEPFIEKLQIYGVPIKMMAPVTVWDPREAGFTCGDLLDTDNTNDLNTGEDE